jgi:hypothetical protein
LVSMANIQYLIAIKAGGIKGCLDIEYWISEGSFDSKETVRRLAPD